MNRPHSPQRQKDNGPHISLPSPWMRYVNVGLGTLVIAIGAWLATNALPMFWFGLVVIAAVAFLWWQGRTLTLIWAWASLLLGVECFAWPLATMLRIRSAGGELSDDDMGAILSATVMGLFSAVFWIAFSYGLFQREKAKR